ncbi:sel1 repeat family protein [Campylobacter sp. JMF_06 NA1]|uniref:tetratricopeptide repeat protein n=1 Tax=Campylobacter sp. JMF_06 NA1 TaxID=2983823 RepID=UPI0022E9BCAA|nr:tetratricopeptide repeat protein [Campylobacter sp. JMF_06 NA1]MDA3078137.1 sel1 repeat family protein [Campylobacter sp. JMF_06 NA1]
MKKICFLFVFFGIFAFANEYQKILKELDIKCNNNEAIACHQLGNLYFYSRGENKNPQKAKMYYKKAQNINQKLCEKNDYMACYNLAMILIDEKTEPNFQKAKEYIDKTCEFKDGLGVCYCGLGVLYGGGKGVEKNMSLANSYFEKSCDLNFFVACKYLGDYYRDKEQNLEIAKKYYKKSCDLGFESSCE